MLYVSDHGESLGEHGLYLHGLPWSIAPENQKQVPMMMWTSPSFDDRHPRFGHCVEQLRDQPLSHDNLFHTILGLFQIRTRDRIEALDLTARCLKAASGTA